MHRVLRNKSRFLTVRILIPVLQITDKQWFLRFKRKKRMDEVDFVFDDRIDIVFIFSG